MQSEDRIIHFSVELIHRPAPLKKEGLQKLYYDLSQSRIAGYDGSDFTHPQQMRFYSRRGQKTQSIALFLPDRAVLLEEWTDQALSDFSTKVEEVGARLEQARGVRRIMAHTATIRSTFALTHFEDARVFLLDHVCAQQDRIGPFFKRPIATGGLRFVLPESNEHQGALHVLIESFRQSRNEVFVEVKGIFGRRQIAIDEMGIALDSLRQVRAFISDAIFPYLNQYDV